MRGKSRHRKGHRPAIGHPWGYGKQVNVDGQKDKNETVKQVTRIDYEQKNTK